MGKRGFLVIIIILAIGSVIGYNTYPLLNKPDCSWQCQSCIVNSSGNAKPILDTEYINNVVNAINNAHDFVHIAMYEFKIYNTTMPIINALIRAKQKGVDVDVIIDASSWNKKLTSENKKTITYLKQHDVNAKQDSKKTTLHSKVVVIDNNTVIVGSTNIGYYALTKNHEANILIKDENIAQQFENYFEFLWNKAS